jgi:polyisoprenoid-binding protein YceI
MRRLNSALLLAATTMLVTASSPVDADRYVIDKAHSYVGFTVRHMMVTNVRGKFNKFEGEILLDQKDITKSSANFTIETASVDTDHERRDKHLRSDDFFNAEQYPVLTFRSRRVVRKGKDLSLVGDLTIRDVTREVVIPFEMTGPVQAGDRKRIGVEAHLTINRFDYGLKYNRMAEATVVVAPDVKVELNIEANTVAP